MTSKNSTKKEEYNGSGSYQNAINGDNEKPKKRISLKELAERSASKIITDNKLREVVLPVTEEEELVFNYKPLEKSDYLKAQTSQDPGKAMDYILSHTLWDLEKGKIGNFMSVDEINKAIPMEWQVLILNEIVIGSGHVLTKEDADF